MKLFKSWFRPKDRRTDVEKAIDILHGDLDQLLTKDDCLQLARMVGGMFMDANFKTAETIVAEIGSRYPNLTDLHARRACALVGSWGTSRSYAIPAASSMLKYCPVVSDGREEATYGMFFFLATDVVHYLRDFLKTNPDFWKRDEGEILDWLGQPYDPNGKAVEVPVFWGRFCYAARQLSKKPSVGVVCTQCNSAYTSPELRRETSGTDVKVDHWVCTEIRCPNDHLLMKTRDTWN